MDIITFILLAVVCLLVGFFIGRMVRQFNEPDDQTFPQKEKLDDDDIHIAREDSTGKLIILHKRKTYYDARSLPLEVHNKVLQMLIDLQLWTGNPQKPKKEDASEKDSLLNKQDSIFTEPGGKKTEPVSLISSLTHPLRKETADDKVEKSIIAQIDEILQEKLADSDLRDRGIRLMESSNRGLVVLVGLDQYENIGDIPDDAIVRVIRQSVSEWEAIANK